MPDEAAATLVGHAKGRLEHDRVPVPANVLIESKAESLTTGMPPWIIRLYSEFCTTTKTFGETTRKRKRENVSSSAPQELIWEGI